MKNKFKEIGEGWLNVIIKNAEIEQEAERRLGICDGCPSKTKQLGMDVCGECHCPLLAKARSSDSECPLNRW